MARPLGSGKIQLFFCVACLLAVFAFTGDEREIVRIRSLYALKGKPQPGDWLETHEEKYYSLADYIHTEPSRPDSLRKFIYVYRLGEATRAEDSLLSVTCVYLERFFHLKTKLAQTFPVSCVPETMKRDLGSEIQVQTHFVLDTLVNLPLPPDAAIALCFTKYDLYPGEDWNFVFGQAYLHERAGVWSFNRYGDPNNAQEFKEVLRRTLKVASHETGHMFSIKHCIRYACVMNGSNSLHESDAKPMYYCPDCLEKLCWNARLNLPEHFKGLLDFYEKYGFTAEAAFMKKNLRELTRE